jgi:predicted RNase H-like nuclease
MKERTVILGIDLAWGERNPDGVTRIEFDPTTDEPPARIETRLLRGDEALLSEVSETDGARRVLLAVDAPMICPNESGSRPVDRECTSRFGRNDAGCYPANRKLCRRPLRLAAALLERGFSLTTDLGRSSRIVCEVYPHPATIHLFGIAKTIKYKKGRVAEKRVRFTEYQTRLRECLARELPALLESPDHRTLLASPWTKEVEDQTDSILCALIGFLHLRYQGRRSEVLGDDETGHILLPTAVPLPGAGA